MCPDFFSQIGKWSWHLGQDGLGRQCRQIYRQLPPDRHQSQSPIAYDGVLLPYSAETFVQGLETSAQRTVSGSKDHHGRSADSTTASDCLRSMICSLALPAIPPPDTDLNTRANRSFSLPVGSWSLQVRDRQAG